MEHYQKIQQSYKEEADGIFDGHVIIEEKLDGCFQYNTDILLDDGTVEKIGKIVNNKLSLNVLSYNKSTEKIESKKIINWFKNGKTSEWLQIECRGKATSRKTKFKVTPNHQIYVYRNGKIVKKRAGELVVNDVVFRPDFKIDYIQEQLIYGSLLGDASMFLVSETGNPRFSVGHSEKQSDYLYLKHKIMSNFSPCLDSTKSGYGSNMIRFHTSTIPSFKQIYDICFKNNKKYVSSEWLNKLGLMGIAFWYMDDGSSSFNDTQKPRLSFAINSFSNDECNNILDYFRNNGYECSVHDYKGNTLVFSANSSEKLFREISYFIPKSMEYKIPEHCRNKSCFWDSLDYDKLQGMSLMKTDVLSIEKVSEFSEKYDIEIEDNHNYFANRILVSNSQFRVEINTDGTIVCGSHHQDGVTVDSMFNDGVKNAHRVFAGYKPDVKMTVFCEYLSKPKQNAIPYARIPLHNLMVFDVKRDTRYLDRPQKELFCKQHGLEVIPLLWEGDGDEISTDGKINDAFKDELLKKQSILGHQKGFDRIEGFVIKNYNKFYDVNRYPHYEGHWKCVKIVNDTFKEKNKEENPNRANKFQELKDNYRTEARMLKSIQHLKERGLLTGQLSDLKLLIPEVIRDIEEEEKENIKETLWKMFGKEITGYASKEMVTVYKKYLETNE